MMYKHVIFLIPVFSILISMVVSCGASAPESTLSAHPTGNSEYPLSSRFREFAASADAELGKSLLNDGFLKHKLSRLIHLLKGPKSRPGHNRSVAREIIDIAIVTANNLQRINSELCSSSLVNATQQPCLQTGSQDEQDSDVHLTLESWNDYLKANNFLSHFAAGIVLPFLEYARLFPNDKAYRKTGRIREEVRNACAPQNVRLRELYQAVDGYRDNIQHARERRRSCQQADVLYKCRQRKLLLACFVFHFQLTEAATMICEFVATQPGGSNDAASPNLNSLKTVAARLLSNLSRSALPACVCRTKACHQLAQLLIRQINTSGNSCHDFYGYACGGLMSSFRASFREMQEQMMGMYSRAVRKAMPVLMLFDSISVTIRKAIEEDTNFGENQTVPVAVEHAKLFYGKCLLFRRNYSKTDRTAMVVNFIQTFWSAWPFLNNNSLSAATDSEADVYALLGRLLGELNIAPLIRLRVMDEMGSFILEPALFGTVNFTHEEVFLHRVESVKKSLRILAAAAAAGSVQISGITINATAEQVAEMEKTLVMLSAPDFDFNDTSKHLMTLAVAYERMPGLRPFLDHAFRNEQDLGDSGAKNRSAAEAIASKQVLFMCLRFTDRLSALLRDPLSRRTLLHMIMLSMLESLAFMFDENLREHLAAYESVAERTVATRQLLSIDRGDDESETEAAADQCAREAREYFPAAVDWLYVTKSFQGQKENSAKAIVENLKEAAKGVLLQSELITTDASREAFLRKLESMLTHVGYSKALLDDKYLNAKSSKRVLDHADYFSSSVNNLMKWEYAKVNDAVNASEQMCWPPTTPNACFEHHTSALTIPAGFFEFPFFDISYPLAFQYGLLGATIGHEIFHAYDDHGIKVGPSGAAGDDAHLFQTCEEAGNFHKRRECLRVDANAHFCYSVGRFHPFENESQSNTRNYRGLDNERQARPFNLVTDGARPRQKCGKGSDDRLLEKTAENKSCVRSQHLNEIMSDINGLKAAFQALVKTERSYGTDIKLPGLEQYSTAQLFFLAFSTPFCEPRNPFKRAVELERGVHPPPDARLNLALRHSPDFANAFKCPHGGILALRERACRIY